MPTIAQKIADNQARIAAGGKTGTGVGPEIVQAPITAAPTPPQDLPVGGGLPQRGMFPADLTLNSDRSDSNRAFRGAGMRSSVFPYSVPKIIAAPTSSGQQQQAIQPATPATSSISAAAATPALSTIAFRGAWDAGTVYFVGDEVAYGGSYYVAILGTNGGISNVNQEPDTATTYWAPTNVSDGETFQGAWVSTTQYFTGAEVSYNGAFYVALQNGVDEQPDISASYWQQVSSPASQEFLGAWSSATAYTVGNQVIYNGNFYICISPNTNKEPDLYPADWQVISTSYLYLGTYSGSTNYVPGNQVSYQGNFYICISATTGNAPSTTSSYWTLLGTSAILIGAWSSGTAYVAGNEVTYQPSGGAVNYYVALQGSTNQNPSTATAYWYLIANNTGIVSASSYRPTSNPLTATDAGSNVTITIASFTMNISGVGAVSVNGGTITGLSYATVYYIFYADPTIAGGTVSFQDATTKTSAISSGVNFFVGSILTPPMGGGTTSGNNDGGTGAQAGGTITLFPTTWTVTVGGPWSSATAAIDGNPATSSSPPDDGGDPDTVVVAGLPPIIFPSTANVVLVLDWSCAASSFAVTSVSVANPTASLSKPNGPFSRTVNMISLGANFNPALTEITINMTSDGVGFSNLYGVYLLVEF